MSIAATTMLLAATQPQALGTPDLDLSALILDGALASPSGDVLAAIFGGQLNRSSDSDVLSVGAGPADAATLAELLDSTNPSANVFHVNYEFETHARTQVLNVFTDDNARTKHDSKPSTDESGGVDCTGATICQTDPVTRITTLSYPDGVVAIVEQINDITLVAYKTLGAAVFSHPGAPGNDAPAPTTPAPSVPPTPTTDPTPAPAEPTAPPSAGNTGPRLNIVRPPADFSPGRSEASTTSPGAKAVLSESADKLVNDVLNQVSDTVKRLFKPGNTASGTGRPASPSSTGEE